MEGGLKGFVVSSGFSFIGPAGMPKPVVEKLNGALAKSLQDPTGRKELINRGADPVGNTSEQHGAYIKAEFLRYGQIHRNTYINAPELLNAALVRHKVLFFRGQAQLDDASHQAFGARFGRTVEDFLDKPQGTMQMVLGDLIKLSPEEKKTAVEQLHQFYADYQKKKGTTGSH